MQKALQKVSIILVALLCGVLFAHQSYASIKITPTTSGYPNFYITDWTPFCSGNYTLFYNPYIGSYPNGTAGSGGTVASCEMLTSTSFALANIPGIFANAPGFYYVVFNATGGYDNYVEIYWSGSQIQIDPSSSTRFITPYSPSNGTTTGSTAVSFSAPYFFDDTSSYSLYDTVAFDIVDATSGNPPYRFGQTTINSSGYSTLSSSQTLIAGHLYMWHPVMYSSTGSSSPISGDYYTLNVLYESASSTPYIGATLGTSTLPSSTNLLSFLNVPNLLATKVPFGYFFQAKDAILNGANSTSSTAIPSGTFSIRGIGHGTTTVDMFSTSTVGYFLSSSTISLLRGLMVAVLYFEFIYLLYLRGKSRNLI